MARLKTSMANENKVGHDKVGQDSDSSQQMGLLSLTLSDLGSKVTAQHMWHARWV